jgi:hypothetical protein
MISWAWFFAVDVFLSFHLGYWLATRTLPLYALLEWLQVPGRVVGVFP